MSRGVEKTALQAASLFGLILCVLTGIWAWQAGLLTSQERLQAFVASCGAAGGLLFVAFQMVQVVVPVLPGGLGCLVGVVLFGPVMGFVYNYVGICIGSLLAFAVTGLHGCSPWRSFSRWRRTTSCAIWRAPPP